MMRTVAFTLLSLLLWVGSASAQITVPNTFVASTRIVSADVNQNFSTLGTNALNRTGGTMTGTLTSLGIVPTTHNVSDIGASGTRYANVYSVQGNFSGRVGVGVTPVSGSTTDLQVSDAVSLHTFGGGYYANLYNDGAWKYHGNGYGGLLYFDNATGAIQLWMAPSNAGGAGAAAPIARRLNISAAGEVTASAQPGFLSYNSTTDTSLGTGTQTVDFDAEVYDVGADFSADTFTAPITGTYLLCAHARVQADTAIVVDIRIATSNRDYSIVTGDKLEEIIPAESNTVVYGSGCVLADMDAADTATVEVENVGTVDRILGGPSSTWYVTWFSGRLVP